MPGLGAEREGICRVVVLRDALAEKLGTAKTEEDQLEVVGLYRGFREAGDQPDGPGLSRMRRSTQARRRLFRRECQ